MVSYESQYASPLCGGLRGVSGAQALGQNIVLSASRSQSLLTFLFVGSSIQKFTSSLHAARTKSKLADEAKKDGEGEYREDCYRKRDFLFNVHLE